MFAGPNGSGKSTLFEQLKATGQIHTGIYVNANKIEKQIELYLNLLTGRQREAVYLRFIEEMEYEEIAIILEMSAPAVRKLVCRAIARIRTEELSLVMLLCISRMIN